MSRRARAVLALLGSGLLLLATTQPWVRTVVEVAEGAPRSRGSVVGADLVPWLAPVTLAGALAVVAGLAGLRGARGVAALTAPAVAAGVTLGVLGATGGEGPGAVTGGAVVSATSTGWLWVAVLAAVVTCLGTLPVVRPGRRPTPRPGRAAARESSAAGPAGVGRELPGPAGDDAESERRQAAADWRDLTEGRDPTDL